MTAAERQVSADNVTYCLNLPVTIPVSATDFSGISSFIIELEFDPAILTFNGLINVNQALENGTFSVSVTGNILQIRYSIWNGSASITNGDELFRSSGFNSLTVGLSDLRWNWLECVIYSAGGYEIPTVYTQRAWLKFCPA